MSYGNASLLPIQAADEGGSSDSGKLIGIIVGSSVGAFALIALAVCCCFMCLRPAASAPTSHVNDFDTLGTYQMPRVQQRRWMTGFAGMPQAQATQEYYVEPMPAVAPTAAPVYFNRPLFRQDFVAKRFQPNSAYGGRY